MAQVRFLTWELLHAMDEAKKKKKKEKKGGGSPPNAHKNESVENIQYLLDLQGYVVLRNDSHTPVT